ncbi:MAG TPA: putative baseplate assembly protein [Blastocatellia bacterium]|nr:putative baseplate assembly protein [Blastocatellia bacterium]
MSLCCQQDDRRDQVRRMKGLNGLDYVEVLDDQKTIHAYFLGKLPPELEKNKPGIEQYLRLEGGQRITDIQIEDVDPVVNPDPERDDFLVIKLDKYGDFSFYTLRLVGVANVDPRYDQVDFSFKVNCPSDLDCAPACTCEPTVFSEPEINYLAKDYQSFRQLILDRLSILIPEWKERHVPDIGIMLVEVLAYTGDYLSYYQDAVATEAYIDTARQRISVRRHARLVDYLLHEGCNARAWVCIEVDADIELDVSDISFITSTEDAVVQARNILKWEDLANVQADSYEVFEPLVADRFVRIKLLEAHNQINFYTFGEDLCCLETGSTSATLLDCWIVTQEQKPYEAPTQAKELSDSENAKEPDAYEIVKEGQKNSKDQSAYKTAPKPNYKKERALKLKPGDVLIFEEVIGPITGLPADADPMRRHAVRITSVTPGEDKLRKTKDGQPTPYIVIEWAPEDALPFTFCISAIGPAPDCDYLGNVSVARGNVILVDHGKTQNPEDFGPVPTVRTEASCECVDEAGDIEVIPGRFSPVLSKSPITYSVKLPKDKPADSFWVAAACLLTQEPRESYPHVWITSQPAFDWQNRYDLIASGPDDKHFVVEIDNSGKAHLRFGKGDLGYQPAGGMTFRVTYRVGNGTAGNVGAESISRLVLTKTSLGGVAIRVRNPLAARGGAEPEPMDEAKLFAPHLFRKQLQRAIIAGDYQALAARNKKLQRASGVLLWTGSWYEADVAVDPLGSETVSDALLKDIEIYLERYRRMGHDLHIERAEYVPILLALEVCALPQYQPAHVKAALLDAFSNRVLPGGKRGFFHPDNLTFGGGIFLSQIIAAAQAVEGVECVQVKKLQRLFAAPNHEIANGVLPLGLSEIAQLDNDPSFPERGKLEIHVSGGR